MADQQFQSLLPVSSYTLELTPGEPQLAVEDGTVRITLAAIDPENNNGDKPSTLRILKKVYDDDEDDLSYPIGEDEDSEEEEEEKPKKGKKDAKKNKKQQKESDEESDEELEKESDDESFEISRTVICTLSPKTGYQQTLDIVINASDDIVFEVTGSFPIHLTGNYVMHPFDDESDSDDEDDNEDDYDLSPDEDELDFSNRIQPVESESESESEEEAPKEAPKKETPKKETKKQNKKRAAEEETPAPVETKKQNKKQKSEDKKVAFSKQLEQGPTGSTSAPAAAAAAAKKGPVAKKIAGGVTIEDRKVGSGPTAQPGDKVSVRYIGKLLNGNIFDSNTKGKPFAFKLGSGEVIKGWDVGVAGMSVKGERRIVIPPSSAYGKQALPGIPANSTLAFDVKLVGIK